MDDSFEPTSPAEETREPGPETESAASAPHANRTVFARLYEDEQKIDTRSRWSVGGAHRVCHDCSETLADGALLYSTLVASQVDPSEQPFRDVSELFERLDFCEACFGKLSEENSFAFWKSIADPPPRPPQKILNLAALLAYFRHLAPEPEVGDEDPDAAAPESEGRQDAPQFAFPTVESADAEPLRYLLGLFLVRKRVLRWVGLADGVLTLTERKSEESHELPVPEMTEDRREAMLASFEELFG